ncbi:TPR repeat, putative [Trypanosoma equiperdum]|uniref:Cdc23 domain-containing protein n=2 Tax=Trypanozoon TaxID=39700 RepID=Q4GYI6_TRYB2|nr:hypothetical protein, conserved [Trypanosoma brucei brucei TREU927]CAJ16598.1 hypothetical protein, conserved [Trypanosoma brucei brucei TREU927]SCU64454.1 TPR repeat, putative [Trypanosoma equiperdum]
MHQQDPTAGNNSGRGFVTVAEALDRAMKQCMQRGLFDTSTWLAQLALDASDSVLRQTLRTNAPAVLSLQDPPLVGRAHRHHVVALGLMQKGEYLRCHHHLSNALRDYNSCFSAGLSASTPSSLASAGITASRTEEPSGSAGDADGEEGATGREHFSFRRGGGRSTPPPRRQQQHQQSPLSKKATVPQAPPPQLQFLCLYSLYMAGECVKTTSSNPRKTTNPHLRMLRGLLLSALERQQQQQQHQGPQSSPTHPSSSAIRGSSSLLSVSSRPSSRAGPRLTQTGSRPSPPVTPGAAAASVGVAAYGDPFLCWLHGVVLRDLGMKQESATYFLAAVCNHPLLWCVWEDLCTLVSRENQIEEIEAMVGSLEPRFMPEIFLASVKAALNVSPISFVLPTAAPGAGQRSASPHFGESTTSLQSATQEYGRRRTHSRRDADGSSNSCVSPRLVNSWEVLLEQFPNNLFLLSNLAGYYYNVKKDLEKAHSIYKQLHEASPYRLESMDDYSIVLFLRGDRIGLSSLAQQVYHVDPFRAESNYVVGNYYVLMGAHDRGVLHFRRAVAADPTFIAAWTLLGHAYLETKNSAAAVEAYRAAVDLDQRDYRGWYNLGQIYELLQFYHHALYYYWHTTTLRPTDPRMWSAVANCLDREGRTGEAMLCLEHAEACESPKSDFYPPLVRRLGQYYLSIRKVQRAVTYLEKLLASEAKKHEDVLMAVPHVVTYYLRQAKQLLDIPARSPSYNPVHYYGGNSLTSTVVMETGCNAGASVYDDDGCGAPLSFSATGTHRVESFGSGPGVKAGGSLADQWLTADAVGRRSIDVRWEQAGACLSITERHLENLAAALGFPTLQAAVDSTMNRPSDSSVSGGDAMLEEGRNRHAAQLAHHFRELKNLQYYLRDQQQQVDTSVRQGERA